MRTRTWLLVVIYPTLLSWACSDGTGMPTGPSAASLTPAAPAATVVVQDVPSLMGPWRALGTTTFRNLQTGNVLNWGGCSGAFTITAQDGQRFSASLHTQGGSFTSDRFCTASGTFTGELVEPDGSLARARLEGNFQNWPRPSVSPSCEVIAAGDGIWTGSATRDAVRLQVRDVLRCAVNVDGGVSGMPMADFERTVSFSFQR